jgi:hypothetical protein
MLLLHNHFQSRLRSGRIAVAALLLLITPSLIFGIPCGDAMTRAAGPQISTEKESRTAAQQKIDSQLLYAIYQMRGEAKKKGTPTTPIPLRKDEKGRVLVDVRAQVTEKLERMITKLGGIVSSRSERYHSILAYVPLGKIETLAESKEVKFIGPAAESMTH